VKLDQEMSSDLIISNIRSVLVFSDSFPQLQKSLPVELVCGLVGAEIWPTQDPQLRRVANLQYILLNNGTTPNSNDILEIMRILLNLVFSDLALQRIYVHAVRTDLTTARYCEEAGFTQDNTSRQSFSYDGEQVDIVTMAVSHKT